MQRIVRTNVSGGLLTRSSGGIAPSGRAWYINGMSTRCWCGHSERSHILQLEDVVDKVVAADYPAPLHVLDSHTEQVAICLACARLEARTGANCTPRHAYSVTRPALVDAEAARVLAEMQPDRDFT